MTSQLIISHQPVTDLTLLLELGSLPRLPPHPDIFVFEETPHLTIKSVRELIAFLNLPPLTLPVKYALIKNAHLLTIPAQQALLKTLEEPPHNAQLILLTHRPQELLATIHSRVRALTLKTTASKSNPPYTPTLEELLHLEPTNRLSSINHLINNRDQATAWLRLLLTDLEKTLHARPSLSTAHNLESVHTALVHLEHNAHIALTLDNLVLNLETASKFDQTSLNLIPCFYPI